MQKRPHGWELNGVVITVIAMAARLVVLFALIGLAYAIYMHFGAKWFYVFIFAAIAVRLHLELTWIERHFEQRDSKSAEEPNPFRKR
jgi:hypothetical protein